MTAGSRREELTWGEVHWSLQPFPSRGRLDRPGKQAPAKAFLPWCACTTVGCMREKPSQGHLSLWPSSDGRPVKQDFAVALLSYVLWQCFLPVLTGPLGSRRKVLPHEGKPPDAEQCFFTMLPRHPVSCQKVFLIRQFPHEGKPPDAQQRLLPIPPTHRLIHSSGSRLWQAGIRRPPEAPSQDLHLGQSPKSPLQFPLN